MKDSMTEAWAWVVAILIYALIIVTVFAYFGYVVLWLRKVLYG